MNSVRHTSKQIHNLMLKTFCPEYIWNIETQNDEQFGGLQQKMYY